MNHQLIPRVGQRCSLRQQRSLPKILHHHYVLESFFKSWNVPLENVVGVCVWGGMLFGAPWWANVEWDMGLKSFLCFIFLFLQAVLADLSTLKVMPLIQIFLYATTI